MLVVLGLCTTATGLGGVGLLRSCWARSRGGDPGAAEAASEIGAPFRSGHIKDRFWGGYRGGATVEEAREYLGKGEGTSR